MPIPQPREVWYVKDGAIRLHENKREDKDNRLVLIAASEDLLVARATIINVIPFSTSGNPDLLSIPIARGYEKTKAGFVPSKDSLALLQWYQPIEIHHFEMDSGVMGVIEEVCYNSILHTLCTELIGYSDFDLGVE